MTEDPDGPTVPKPAPRSPDSRRRPDQPRPVSRLEIMGWTTVAIGVLILVYFALTRAPS